MSFDSASFFCFLSLTLACIQPAPAQADLPNIPIGAINYFGYAGIDLAPIEAGLPIKVGDGLPRLQAKAEETGQFIEKITGAPPTDLDIVCCDADRHILIFLGLEGMSYRKFPAHAAPTGTATLDPRMMALYKADLDATMAAVQKGHATEDDSAGYTLTRDPATRRIQLEMRAYAEKHEDEIRTVLAEASEAKQRVAAAMLLGYAQRSAGQIQALAAAIYDPDGEVRNNAMRALEVLASAKKAAPLKLDAQPVIALLYSGKWSDRNKASLLLMKLTQTRDAALLHQLRASALAPIVEGANWHGDPGHRDPFLLMLGRIAGISEVKITEMMGAGQFSEIIAAAQGMYQTAK